jgi:hypothetical protein
VERDGKSLLEWIRIHSLRGLPDLAGPELGFSRTPTASVLRNDACLRLPARNTYNLLAVVSAVIFPMPCKRGAFVRRFTTIRQLVDFFLVVGRSMMKSIEISAKALSGIGRSFNSPFFRSR